MHDGTRQGPAFAFMPALAIAEVSSCDMHSGSCESTLRRSYQNAVTYNQFWGWWSGSWKIAGGQIVACTFPDGKKPKPLTTSAQALVLLPINLL
eukprot:SAG31_NODE_452_length_15484_cov_20.883198_12_plen_94_part_00